MFSYFSLIVVLQPDTITGDIVFVLQQKDHSKFKRKFDDLYMEHTLTLTEALCGFQFVLTHLDGRQLLIKSNPGEVIKPGKHLLPLCCLCGASRVLSCQVLQSIYIFLIVVVSEPTCGHLDY